MGMKTHEVGGGPATGLANDFTKFLESGLTGSFGGAGASSQTAASNPFGSTMGFAGVLNDIMSGGAGNLGGSLAKLISTQQGNDIAGLRSRFGAGGGTAFGTPAAYAESTYRAQAAPQIATAIGQLQMQTLGQLLPIYANLAGKGIAQRETVAQPNPWVQAAQLFLPIAGQAFGAAGEAGGFGNLFGGGGGGGYGGASAYPELPQMPANYPVGTIPGYPSAPPMLSPSYPVM